MQCNAIIASSQLLPIMHHSTIVQMVCTALALQPSWSVHTSSDFIEGHRTMLVFYACGKPRTKLAGTFVRGSRRAISPDEITTTLNFTLVLYNKCSAIMHSTS